MQSVQWILADKGRTLNAGLLLGGIGFFIWVVSKAAMLVILGAAFAIDRLRVFYVLDALCVRSRDRDDAARHQGNARHVSNLDAFSVEDALSERALAAYASN